MIVVTGDKFINTKNDSNYVEINNKTYINLDKKPVSDLVKGDIILYFDKVYKILGMDKTNSMVYGFYTRFKLIEEVTKSISIKTFSNKMYLRKLKEV
jgi:hypothetical protein